MISGRFESDQLGPVVSPTAPCPEIEALYGIEGYFAPPSGYGAPYSNGGSWLGIKSAALCLGITSDLRPGYGWSELATMFATWGLGLAVVIDLDRLPGGSLDNCAMVVVGEKPETGRSIGNRVPSRYVVSGQVVSEGGALVTISRVTEQGTVGYPEIDFNYVIQGICTK